MRFEWDAAKAQSNVAKHQVTFSEEQQEQHPDENK